jgi:hypothetical protein
MLGVNFENRHGHSEFDFMISTKMQNFLKSTGILQSKEFDFDDFKFGGAHENCSTETWGL